MFYNKTEIKHFQYLAETHRMFKNTTKLIEKAHDIKNKRTITKKNLRAWTWNLNKQILQNTLYNKRI